MITALKKASQGWGCGPVPQKKERGKKSFSICVIFKYSNFSDAVQVFTFLSCKKKHTLEAMCCYFKDKFSLIQTEKVLLLKLHLLFIYSQTKLA